MVDDGNAETLTPADLAVEVFRAYIDRRVSYYANHRKLLGQLLKKDVLMYALRGIRTSDEFVMHAFAAHESSSEETMWGHAWQQALAESTPHAVGGGDLRLERDGILWIIQLKIGTEQNASAEAQDIRLLKTKVHREVREHHPGRKNVMPMYAIIRGPSRDEWTYFRNTSGMNPDIDGFGYQYKVGSAFLTWIAANIDVVTIYDHLGEYSVRAAAERTACIASLQRLLRDRLQDAGLEPDIVGVLALAQSVTATRTARD